MTELGWLLLCGYHVCNMHFLWRCLPQLLKLLGRDVLRFWDSYSAYSIILSKFTTLSLRCPFMIPDRLLLYRLTEPGQFRTEGVSKSYMPTELFQPICSRAPQWGKTLQICTVMFAHAHSFPKLLFHQTHVGASATAYFVGVSSSLDHFASGAITVALILWPYILREGLIAIPIFLKRTTLTFFDHIARGNVQTLSILWPSSPCSFRPHYRRQGPRRRREFWIRPICAVRASRL